MKRKKTAKELMMVSLTKGIELYLSTLAVEGKSPRYIDWLKTRLAFFENFCLAQDPSVQLQDLTLEDGRAFLRSLMERDHKWEVHPMHKKVKGKLATSYIHGCGRAIRSFASWGLREGYLEANVFAPMKLPKLPKTFPEPLSEDEIRRVLETTLHKSMEPLRDFAVFSLLFDTGLRLSEATELKVEDINFSVGEARVVGKGNKERIVPVGLQAKRARINYIEKERPEPTSPTETRLFLMADAYAMNPNSMEKMFQRTKEKAGLNRLYPHLCAATRLPCATWSTAGMSSPCRRSWGMNRLR
jgi:site-specific recombinase XerD